jgi:type VI secretion system protein ImpH
VAFVALAGLLGPLPPSYTEAALLARKRRSTSLAAFFDIFVQRLAELFVRAAEKYCLPAASPATLPMGHKPATTLSPH